MSPHRLPLSERDFQEQIIQLAKLHGWMVHAERSARTKDGWRTAIQGDPGFPDLVLAREGVVIYAELKSEKGKVAAGQQAWRWALGAGRLKANVYVWRPSDWAQIERALAARDAVVAEAEARVAAEAMAGVKEAEAKMNANVEEAEQARAAAAEALAVWKAAARAISRRENR